MVAPDLMQDAPERRMTGDAAYLSIRDVSKNFGTTRALAGVSLSLDKGAFVALLGPSGCGKSTLLRIIAGLMSPDGGEILLDGSRLDNVAAHRRDIGLVFQSYALFPHLSVADNVRFGLDMRHIGRDEAGDRVEKALALVKLAGYGRRMPAELSGGQQQRVALARAIVIGPRLLLLDEPLSNLDAVLRKSVRVEIRELHQRTGLTTVMVTHDQEEAMSIADRVAVMSEGRIVQYDTPEAIYERPATTFVAGFVGNPPPAMLPLARDGDVWRLGANPWTPPPEALAALARHARATIGLRADRLALAEPDAPGTLLGTVRSLEYLGGGWLAHVDVRGETDPFTIAVRTTTMPVIGSAVGIAGPMAALILFDEAGERIATS
jgi:ABC-type Fe3+/spermidine/putrescine transport system ATPase subunit